MLRDRNQNSVGCDLERTCQGYANRPSLTDITIILQEQIHPSRRLESTIHVNEHACQTSTPKQRFRVDLPSTLNSRGGLPLDYHTSKPTTRHDHFEAHLHLNRDAHRSKRPSSVSSSITLTIIISVQLVSVQLMILSVPSLRSNTVQHSRATSITAFADSHR